MNPPCPHCTSTLVVKNGHKFMTGEQKYKCRNCYKEWHEGSKLKVRTGRPCYYCGKPMAKRGSSRGVKHYECCGVVQTENMLNKLEPNYYWKEEEE